jgi:mRNA interferase RelE/StbE
MRVAFRTSFLRDLKKVKDRRLLDRVQRTIQEVESTVDLSKVNNLKKLTGIGNFFRIRIGDYRLGLALEKDVIEFVRCLPRKDLYRFFP